MSREPEFMYAPLTAAWPEYGLAGSIWQKQAEVKSGGQVRATQCRLCAG